MQLALQFKLRNDSTFASYYPGKNTDLSSLLTDIITKDNRKSVQLFGSTGVGKTHLLHSVCNLSSYKGLTAVYIPLKEYITLDVQILDNLERLKLVCIDDIQVIVGDLAWEERLLNLYKGLELNGHNLVITSNIHYSKLNLLSTCLKDKLLHGNIEEVVNLSNDEKIKVIQRHANCKGLDLMPTAAKFLLTKSCGNMHELFAMLDALDSASWIKQRKITVPFIKQELNVN